MLYCQVEPDRYMPAQMTNTLASRAIDVSIGQLGEPCRHYAAQVGSPSSYRQRLYLSEMRTRRRRGLNSIAAHSKLAIATFHNVFSEWHFRSSRKNLAFRLALLAQKSADLALVVEVWYALPAETRAGVVVMVRSSVRR